MDVHGIYESMVLDTLTLTYRTDRNRDAPTKGEGRSPRLHQYRTPGGTPVLRRFALAALAARLYKLEVSVQVVHADTQVPCDRL